MKFAIVFVAVAFLHESFGRRHTLEEEYGIIKSLPYNAVKAVTCTGAMGGICSDDVTECGKYFICTIPNKPPVEGKCPGTQTCNMGSCSAIPSALCEYKDLKFKCQTEGMYPDPSSCKKYNYCVPPIEEDSDATPAECPEGWAYNVATTLCDEPLPSKVCAAADRVVPTCTTPGQNAALRTSASYYYVCLPHPDDTEVLYPNIFKCEGNKKYAGNYQCR